MDIGTHLKKLGMTTSQYAGKIGVNQSTISRLCNGAIPTPATMLIIAEESRFRVMPADFYPAVRAAAAEHRAQRRKNKTKT